MTKRAEMMLDGSVIFHCPACGIDHCVTPDTVKRDGPKWSWNGKMDEPTFKPSIKVTWNRLTEKGKQQQKEWADAGYPYRLRFEFDSEQVVCHSFVTDGKINYCADSTHEMAGSTVDLPDVDGNDQ